MANNRECYVLISMIEEGDNDFLTSIPANWLTENDTMNFWPPHGTSNAALKKLRADLNSKPNGKWRRFHCKVRKYGIPTLAEALHTENVYENLSDTEAEIR